MSLETQNAPIQRKGRKFDQVLEGARVVFMAHGFEGASVDDIAKEAGVSKATLYSYFPDKRLLFSAVVRTECQRQCDSSGGAMPVDSPPSEILYGAARQIVASYTSEISQQMFRICVAEAARFPDLGELFYQSGPLVWRTDLRAYLVAASGQGCLLIDDFDMAADQFIELCKADLLLRAVFLNERDFTEVEQHRVAAAAVDMFLAKHGAPSAP